MKKALTAVFALFGTVALAHNCPNEMRAIDAKMPNAKLSAADMAKVSSLRKEGENAHKAGKHDDSMRALSEAKKILGM